jgi:DNA-binding NtrC family response regulator
MTKNVLLVGLKTIILDQVQKNLDVKDVRLFTGSSVEDVRAAFDREPIDIVIMGAGLDIDVRLEIIKLIFSLSETTTVHMKDHASGPEGLIPFVNAVLKGLIG